MFRYQLKLLPWAGIGLSLLTLLLLPFVVSFRFLGAKDVGLIGECVAPVLGLLIFPPLAFREGDAGRREVLASRPVPYWQGYTMRLGACLLLSALWIALLLLTSRRVSLPFDVGAMGLGLWTTSVLFGGMGLVTGLVTRNMPASYLLPFTCFCLEFFTRGRFTGRFFLLSMMGGELRIEKLVLLGVAMYLLLMSVKLSHRLVRISIS